MSVWDTCRAGQLKLLTAFLSVKADIRLQLFYSANNFPSKRSFKIKTIIAVLLNRIGRFLHYPFSPVYSFLFSHRIYKRICELHSKYHFDIIIPTYQQIDNLLAAMIFKKENPNVLISVYALDTFAMNMPLFKDKESYWLKKSLTIVDQMIVMRTRQSEVSHLMSEYGNKIVVSDIPLFSYKQSLINCSKNIGPSDEEIWVYAGATGAPHYKIEDVIRVFLSLPNTKKRTLYFYTNGKKKKKLKKIEQNTGKRIIGHPYVPHDEMMEILKRANVLVSIKYTNQISAKIFE